MMNRPHANYQKKAICELSALRYPDTIAELNRLRDIAMGTAEMERGPYFTPDSTDPQERLKAFLAHHDGKADPDSIGGISRDSETGGLRMRLLGDTVVIVQIRESLRKEGELTIEALLTDYRQSDYGEAVMERLAGMRGLV